MLQVVCCVARVGYASGDWALMQEISCVARLSYNAGVACEQWVDCVAWDGLCCKEWILSQRCVTGDLLCSRVVLQGMSCVCCCACVQEMCCITIGGLRSRESL